MTDKQRRFAIEYAKSGNATEAAKRAGYSEKTAYSQGQRMLKNVEIQKFLQELTEPTENQSIAAAKEVLKFFTDTMRNENAPWKERLRAAENLAKRYGVDKPDKEENDDDKIDGITIQFIDASGNPL